MFNSAAAIRNTLTSGFDGDVKGVWKPLSVKRPLCLHSHLHKRHICAHARFFTVRGSLRDVYQKHFSFFLFFFKNQTAAHSSVVAGIKRSCLITEFRSSGLRLCFQHFLKLMVCRKLWRQRERESQQVSGIINLAIYSPVWTVWFETVLKPHSASLWGPNEACTYGEPERIGRPCAEAC